jgi:hypothetical protein
MGEEQTPGKQDRTDFLISYTSTDRGWAEWIAATLEAEGYQTHLAAWDVRPGANVVLARDEATKQAERTLLVLSRAYLADSTVTDEGESLFEKLLGCLHIPFLAQPRIAPDGHRYQWPYRGSTIFL